MGGRLAPAKTGTFTSEYALPKADGLDIVFTMTRMDESVDILAEAPPLDGLHQVAPPAQAVTPSGPAAEELDLGQGDSAVLPRAVRRVDGESGPYGVRAAQVERLLARLVPKPDGPARAFAVL